MEKGNTIAVDVAQSVFEIAVSRFPGRVSAGHRLRRAEVLAFFAQHPGATVLIEACGSASYWAREIERLGHRVVLLPLTHGARSVLAAAPQLRSPDRLRRWARSLSDRIGHSKAAIAPANKLARYAWAVATKKVDFSSQELAA